MTTDSGIAPVAAPAAPVNPNQGSFNADEATAKPAVPVVPAGGTPAAEQPPVVPPSLTIGDAAAPAVVVPPVVAPEVPAAKAGKVEAVFYEPTGDPKLDMALTFLGKLGVQPDDPGMVLAGKGDFSLLKAKLSTMGADAQGWEANIALGEAAFNERVANDKARAEKDRASIYEVAGGEAGWKAIKEFAAAATADTPHERDAINAALSGGGLAAKAMVAYLKQLADKHAPKEPAKVLTPGAGAPQAPSNGALSPREYTDAVFNLRAGFKGDFDRSPEYAALKARRAMWRAPRGR
jgi:hypothetical protein